MVKKIVTGYLKFVETGLYYITVSYFCLDGHPGRLSTFIHRAEFHGGNGTNRFLRDGIFWGAIGFG